jgi:hypothetical protein
VTRPLAMCGGLPPPDPRRWAALDQAAGRGSADRGAVRQVRRDTAGSDHLNTVEHQDRRGAV